MGVTPYTDPFWEALSEGRLLIHACERCDERFFPPAPLCPACGSEAVDWEESSGRGTLYSFTRQHATADGFPDRIVAGIVELDDGPRLLTPIDAAYEALSIGDRVVIEARDYPHEYDRGRLESSPFFAATVLDE